MDSLVTGQRWIYRPPQGFETSRLVIGAVVPFKDDLNIVCCAVFDAPQHVGANAGETATLPFLPMTEIAFRASVVEIDGVGDIPPEFSTKPVSYTHLTLPTNREV